MATSKRVVLDEAAPRIAPLHLYRCTDHDSFESNNRVSSVILAYDDAQARQLMDAALINVGLRPYKMYRYQLEEIPMGGPMAEILSDGDY